MNKKYFFFDYDGTLTDRRTMKLVPSSKEALDLLQANGHFVALATGRAHYKARSVMDKLGLHNMVCNGGGGIVIDDELVRNNPLDLDKVKQLLREVTTNNIGYELQITDSIDIYSNNNLFDIQCGGRREPTECIINPDFDFEKCDTILKAYISATEQQEQLLPTLKEIGHLRFERGYLIIQHDDKKKGIIELMEYLNAPLEDVVVFGDDTNDINMFDSRWTSIAMGNGVDELKAIASYVADNSYDDGVYKACKKFGWI